MAERGALLVVGATSNAGKSTVVAALCRAWSNAGLSVAPFKAQNMASLSATTASGDRIAVAQAMQAQAARVRPDHRMNPVLLRVCRNDADEAVSEVIVLGQSTGFAGARDYGDRVPPLRSTVVAALTGLREEHDWVICEGAGGAAEINLLDRDLVNLPLAAAAGIPAILVVDIDRGGAFASAYGTWALLPDHLRATLRGFVFNQFRGDADLLADGVEELQRRTGLPVLGVLPHLGFGRLWSEDSLDGDVNDPADDPELAAQLDAQFDDLADWVAGHLDLAALREVAATAMPPGEAPGWA